MLCPAAMKEQVCLACCHLKLLGSSKEHDRGLRCVQRLYLLLGVDTFTVYHTGHQGDVRGRLLSEESPSERIRWGLDEGPEIPPEWPPKMALRPLYALPRK